MKISHVHETQQPVNNFIHNKQEKLCNIHLWLIGRQKDVDTIWSYLWDSVTELSRSMIVKRVHEVIMTNKYDVCNAISCLELPFRSYSLDRISLLIKSIYGPSLDAYDADIKLLLSRLAIYSIIMSRVDEIWDNGILLQILHRLSEIIVVSLCLDDEGEWNTTSLEVLKKLNDSSVYKGNCITADTIGDLLTDVNPINGYLGCLVYKTNDLCNEYSNFPSSSTPCLVENGEAEYRTARGTAYARYAGGDTYEEKNLGTHGGECHNFDKTPSNLGHSTYEEKTAHALEMIIDNIEDISLCFSNIIDMEDLEFDIQR